MQSIEEVESAFLGTLLFNPQNVLDALTLIKAGKPENGETNTIRLYVPKHQVILEAMEACSLEGQDNYFELQDLIAKLAANNELERVGGETYLRGLARQGSPADGAWRSHAANVIATVQTRIVIAAGQALAKEAAEQKRPLAEIIAEVQERIASVRRIGVKPPTLTFAELVETRRAERDDRLSQSGKHKPISTGLTAIDKIIKGGFRRGRTYMFGGVMSMGKSTTMRSLARNAIKEGGAGIIFSTEEPPEVWFDKLIGSYMGIASDRMEVLDLTEKEWDELHRIETWLAETGCIMSTNSSPSPLDVYEDTQSAVVRHGASWAMVDSASKMSAGKDNFFNDTRAVSSCLQNVALDMNIPVIMSGQLINDVNKRENKAGSLWDFQGGVTFAQDFDYVFTLYHEEYYIKRGAIREADRKYDPNVLFMPLVKSRHGEAGNVAAELYINPGMGVYDLARVSLNG